MEYFFDTSIIIEFQKGNPKAEQIVLRLNVSGNSFFINPIVVSEVSFILRKKLNLTITDIEKILSSFEILPVDIESVSVAFRFMSDYGTKPNDSLILASVKLFEIPVLVSLDSDFEKPTKTENIKLLSE